MSDQGSQPDPRNKPPCLREDALAVLLRLREADHEAYFAGGCVRDTLMGQEPADWDIATDAVPQRVRSLFSSTQAVGAAFGVVLVRHGSSVVEVATFRADGIYEDGRRPSAVHFTSAQEDAKRRDFTVNGLFLDPFDDRVIDFVGGKADLENKILRAIGQPQRRFEEDHLRLLRAVRFAARLGFEIEPATCAAIKSSAARLKGISPERVGEEMRLILRPPTRNRAWPLLWQLDLGPIVWRFISPLPATMDMNRSLLLALDAGQTISFGLAIAAATLCVKIQAQGNSDFRPWLGKTSVVGLVRSMRMALRLSNEESEQMTQVLEGIAPLLADEPPTLAAKKRFLAKPAAADSRKLLAALAAVDLRRARVESLQAEFDALAGQDVAPEPLLTGDDLVAAGFSPGPAFKRILDSVYDAQLEGQISSKEQALELARKS